MMSEAIIGVDTGGTFTDFVIRRGRRIEIRKVPSGRELGSHDTVTG